MYPRETWRKLLRKANDLDLNNGGYCDARSGAINFWCGPENKPEGWTGEIEKPQLLYPRDYVGSVTPVWDEEGNLISAFSLKSQNLAIKYAPELDYRQKELYENRAEDLTWVNAEFHKLWQATFPTLPKPKIKIPSKPKQKPQ